MGEQTTQNLPYLFPHICLSPPKTIVLRPICLITAQMLLSMGISACVLKKPK